MLKQNKISEYNLNSYLEESYLLENIVDKRIWFVHLNLTNFIGNDSPDAGQITDHFFSEINLPKIEFFLLLIDRKHIESWSGCQKHVYFQELIEINCEGDVQKIQNSNIKKRGCILKRRISQKTLTKIITQNHHSPLESIAKNKHVTIISTDEPFRLEKLKISKPWGYESWYTGVEKRGVVKIIDEFGKTELPYSLKLFKKQVLAGFQEDLILLKKLNPLSKAVIGDLYYEMHEEKWEVYVVTEIDKKAWPSGVGIIKAGINPDKIKEYKKRNNRNWNKLLLNDFKQAITKYEILRRKIDFSNKSISKALMSKETTLRKKAASFVGDCYVKVGDIISFPALQIHSLQHGIKVIEFQTPHYERMIVMFSQKVITQNHWDTEKALKKIVPEVYKKPKIKNLLKTEGFMLERFVDFPHFTADRLFLNPDKFWTDQLNDKYHILIVIKGEANIFSEYGKSIILRSEDAFFLPNSMGSYTIKNTGEIPLIYLKAMPK